MTVRDVNFILCNLSPRDSRVKTLEKLIYLADSLAKASHHTQSYGERTTLNSAYSKVKQLIYDQMAPSIDVLTVKSSSSAYETELHSSKFYTLVTVVYNFVQYSDVNGGKELVERVLQDTAAEYPDVHIIVGLPFDVSFSTRRLANLRIVRFNSRTSTKETDIWSNLLSHISTEYVYIGRDIVKFSEDIRLNTLVGQLNNIGATVVSSSSRKFRTGQWSHSCEQSVLKNYTLLYTPGYYTSLHSCLLCNHVSAPFITHTQMFKQVHLELGMTAVSGFSLWFLELVKLKRVILSCPESMAIVDDKVEVFRRAQWLDLVKHSQVESIRLANGTEFTYGCDEAETTCPSNKDPSLALSHCCLNELSQGIKVVLRACKAHNIICELSDGTILGVLKFEGVLPWEVDADITMDKTDFVRFKEELAITVVQQGYTFRDSGSYYRFYTPMGWFIEIFPAANIDTRRMSKDGISATHVLLDGEYVTAPESPGLHGRNRYGAEIYQHANHWRKRGGTSSWQFYEAGHFAECVKPGHHSCLDQYVADGSLRYNTHLLR